MEHSLRNSVNYEENLTATESRLRDADVAKEYMNQTKNLILAQALQAMLAQANSLTKAVIRILQ